MPLRVIQQPGEIGEVGMLVHCAIRYRKPYPVDDAAMVQLIADDQVPLPR